LKRLRRGIEIQAAANGAKPRDLKSRDLKSRDLKSRDAKSARATKPSTARRPYPAVVPKYRNPDRPSETWAGRGKKPRWLAAQLKSGKRIDDFRIWHAA
jgi:DNA-binding protein H-NS